MSYQATMCFMPAAVDACALWRMYIPHLNIPGSGFLYTQHEPPLNDISECDVVVVQRLLLQENLQAMKIMRSFGMRIVYDLDDHIWDVPVWNPAHRTFTKAISGIEACMEWADVITVSTPYLKKMIQRQCGGMRNVETKKEIPVVVCENYVDLKYFSYQPDLDNGDKVIIGWGGSNTHSKDIALVASAVAAVLVDYENVYVEFVGENVPDELKGHDRVRSRPWVHVGEYAARLSTWNWDIILAPLEDHPFNYAKSPIKMIEAGAVGKAALCSYIENYTRFCKMDGGCTYSLCSTQTQWWNKLRELVANKEKRLELGRSLRRNVENNFAMHAHVEKWQAVANMAME